MGEEHRVEVVAGLAGCRREKGNTGGCLSSETRRAAVGALQGERRDCVDSKFKVRPALRHKF